MILLKYKLQCRKPQGATIFISCRSLQVGAGNRLRRLRFTSSRCQSGRHVCTKRVLGAVDPLVKRYVKRDDSCYEIQVGKLARFIRTRSGFSDYAQGARRRVDGTIAGHFCPSRLLGLKA